MAFAKTTPDEILLRVVARLIDQVADATAANTFATTRLNDTPPKNPAKIIFAVGFSRSLPFGQRHLAGAGQNIVRVEAEIGVVVWSNYQGDRTGWDSEWLTNDTQGIFLQATEVLKALTVYPLANSSNAEIVIEPMRPVTLGIDPKMERSFGSIQIDFECAFDWDMSDPEE